MFDAFDIMLLSLLAVPTMKALHLTTAQFAVVFPSGWRRPREELMGTLADYVGRRTAMMVKILVCSPA